MGGTSAVERVRRHMYELVEAIGARPPGSPSNQRATTYVREVLESSGLTTTEHRFSTRWWEPGPVELRVAGATFETVANPYSPSGEFTGVVATLSQVEADGPAGRVVLLDRDLAPAPLTPRAFPFLTVEEHSALLRRIEAVRPAAVVTVSSDVPILEDPDLPIPSVTVRPTSATQLLGERVSLRIHGAVHHGEGATVCARSGPSGRRVVVSAHVDSKATTPGAFDNAAGVAAVLAWAEGGLPDDVPIEIVLFNGEDHFDNAGEQAWLAATDLGEITGNVNIDGPGFVGRHTSAVLLGGSVAQEQRMASFLAACKGWESAAPWFESDHAIFVMQGIPALAITSAGVHDLLRNVAHTPADTIDVVDAAALVDLGVSLGELVSIVWEG